MTDPTVLAMITQFTKRVKETSDKKEAKGSRQITVSVNTKSAAAEYLTTRDKLDEQKGSYRPLTVGNNTFWVPESAIQTELNHFPEAKVVTINMIKLYEILDEILVTNEWDIRKHGNQLILLSSVPLKGVTVSELVSKNIVMGMKDSKIILNMEKFINDMILANPIYYERIVTSDARKLAAQPSIISKSATNTDKNGADAKSNTTTGQTSPRSPAKSALAAHSTGNTTNASAMAAAATTTAQTQINVDPKQRRNS
jgi:hypothetical protein